MAGPSVTSKTVLSKPALIRLRSIVVASARLNSYSVTPRALLAPGASSVCPTSTMTRKAARLQVAAADFRGGAPAGSARAKSGALCPSSAARKTYRTALKHDGEFTKRAFLVYDLDHTRLDRSSD